MMPIAPEQQDLIERFLTAQNRIERHLRQTFHLPGETTFSQLIAAFQKTKPGWMDGWQLRRCAELRNALVHDRTEPYQYLSVPLPEVVKDIEQIEQRLVRPECVLPRFQRPVTTISTEDSLTHVLGLVKQYSFSQFPVFQEARFRSLLTENGITRWLARYVATNISLLDLDEITVGRVLEEEEPRENWIFIERAAPLFHALGLFMERELLEAALITQTGKPGEKLLGIITRWDIAALK